MKKTISTTFRAITKIHLRPDFGKGLEAYARSAMVGEAVQLRPTDYPEVAARLVESFRYRTIEVICLAVSTEHAHLLGRFPRAKEVKREVGHAKRHVAYHLANDRPFWAKGCSVRLVTSRSHQVRVFEYIERHREQEAFVWTFRDERLVPKKSLREIE